MSYQQKDTLVIVFGAGGRIGQALLPKLTLGPWTIVGVARDERPPVRPPNVHWIQVDVTEAEHWQRSLNALSGMAEIHEHVIVIDLLLDRSTVPAMRQVLGSGTSYIGRLRTCLAEMARPCSLVLASTTAVLAPRLYQTPYGAAKRQQLFDYRAAGFGGSVLLLPSLVDSRDYAVAAQLVERTARTVRDTTPSDLELVVQPGKLQHDSLASSRTFKLPRQIARAAEFHLAVWTTGRNSLQAHRSAANARLALTPTWLRRRVDHHFAPANLLRKVARRLGTAIRQEGS